MTIIRWRNRPMYNSMLENLIENNFNNKNNSEQAAATNIIENNDAFSIELAAPGRSKEDFELKIDNKVLSVTFQGKDKNEDENQQPTYLLREFSTDSFTRSFSLPKKADTENIKASYTNGVLNITIPKVQPEEALSRSIEIA